MNWLFTILKTRETIFASFRKIWDSGLGIRETIWLILKKSSLIDIIRINSALTF